MTFPAQLEHVVRALLAEGREAGAAALEPIAFPPRIVERRPTVPRWVRCAIWLRDHFHCRYCDGRVIPNSVLELVSEIYPEAFPYHPNWKAGQTHPAFAARAAMVDHVVPGSAGGAWLDETNLVTACNPCNSIKADLSLGQLGWKLLAIATDDWEGLIPYYRQLWVAAGMPKPAYHGGWMGDLGFQVEDVVSGGRPPLRS